MNRQENLQVMASAGMLRWIRNVGFFLLWLWLAGPVAAQSEEGRYLDGLRERQLFELAEAYCRERQQRAELSDSERCELAIQLIRTYSEHAISARPLERTKWFQRAHQEAGQFLTDYPASPRTPLVATQAALTRLAQGELARQESEVIAQNETLLADARTELRAAIEKLEHLSEQVAARTATPSQPGEPTARQWESLQRQIAFHLARALRNQGLSYPAGSDDRANSLSLAVERLDPLTDFADADSLVWGSRIDRMVCYRLLQNPQHAGELLELLLQSGPPPVIALQAVAEKIRLLLAAGELDLALSEIKQGRMLAGARSAELDFAHLETYLAALRAATERHDTEAAARFGQQADAQVSLIQREYGAYWMRRAEALLAKSVTETSSADVATLRKAAESYYRGGLVDQALATYDRAVEQALAAEQSEQAFDLAYTAATIERDRQRHREALERYQGLAASWNKHPRASSAHLLAAVSCAQVARAVDPAERPQWIERYETLLNEHLLHWPESPQAAQVRWWLGNLRRSRRQWQQAIEVYRTIAPANHLHEQAMQGVIECYLAWMKSLAAANESVAEPVAAAIEFLRPLVATANRTETKATSPSRLGLDGTLALARIRLRYQEGQAAEAERLLTAALAQAGDSENVWRAEAQAVLVESLAVQGRHAEAARVLEQFGSDSSAGLIDLAEFLSRAVETADPKRERELAELLTQAVAIVQPHRDELTPATRRKVDYGQALGLAGLGQQSQALELFGALQKRYPQDGAIQEARARLLAQTKDPAVLRQALAAWREIETKSPRAGARWFRARYAQAEAHYRLGDRPLATKLIKLTAVQHPELGGAESKARFDRLLKLCQL